MWGVINPAVPDAAARGSPRCLWTPPARLLLCALDIGKAEQGPPARSRPDGVEETVDELTVHWLAEELLDACRAAGAVVTVIEPALAGQLTEVTQLGDDHCEVAGPLDAARTVGVEEAP